MGELYVFDLGLTSPGNLHVYLDEQCSTVIWGIHFKYRKTAASNKNSVQSVAVVTKQ